MAPIGTSPPRVDAGTGFTLIELLVVVSITGMLSSVVLTSMNSARIRGADAAVQSQLAQMRSAAEIIYNDTGSYASVCTEASATGVMFRAATRNGVTASGGNLCLSMQGNSYYMCTSTSCYGASSVMFAPGGDKWAAIIVLQGGDYFCADSTGVAKVQTTHTVQEVPTTVRCEP